MERTKCCHRETSTRRNVRFVWSGDTAGQGETLTVTLLDSAGTALHNQVPEPQ